MERVKSIDVFRGLGIVLMVLFTLMMALSPGTAFFRHNQPGEAHPGDFVLPLFLFASGMSIVFYVEKRRSKTGVEFYLDTIERFGMLFGLGMLLSIFSAGALFDMDEVALSAILFLLTVLALRLPDRLYLGICAALAAVYYALYKFGMTMALFDGTHLGGYQAAIFYLPVMLAGASLGKGILEGEEGKDRKMKLLLAVSLLSFVALSFVFPIDKMRVSPSFMALSVMVGTIVFAGVQILVEDMRIGFTVLEFLGRKPIRYWVMMFVFFAIPYEWCVMAGACAYPLDYPMLPALALSALFMVFLLGMSALIDNVRMFLRKAGKS